MQADHVIAQCCWHSAFDQSAKAVELQDFLSRWSNTVLNDELSRFFDRMCPQRSTWRIDTLSLDLGDIALDALAHELPRRLRASLQQAMDRMLAQQTASGGEGARLHILNEAATLQELIAAFLRNGNMPWWQSGSTSVLNLLDDQLDNAAQATLALIRDLGRAEAVRQRLVWQAGEPRVRRIIRLLEPAHGTFICAYADNLFSVQAQRRLPSADSGAFRNATWLNILSFLLLERGTLFNTSAFVRANVQLTAQRYQLDPRALLEQLFHAVHALEPMGSLTPAFIGAIKAIHRQEVANEPLAASAVAATAQHADAPWIQLSGMLRHSAGRVSGAGGVHIGQLFQTLSQHDTARMASLLRHEGGVVSVRHGMLQHFSADQLALVVRVLEPQDHVFIVAHVQHTQVLAEQQRWGKRTVWQVMLAYLLDGHGSHFSRRQLVHDTMLRLCRQRGVEYGLFVDMLLHIVLAEHPTHHRFELLAILQELRDNTTRKHATHAMAAAHRLDVLAYLRCARPSATLAAAAKRGMFSARAPHGLLGWLADAQLRGISDAQLSERLLRLTGAADWPQLLGMLEPDAKVFGESLVGSLLHWHKQALLPSLDRMDLAFRLPAMLIQALPAFQHGRRAGTTTFNLQAYWRALTALLRQQTGVDVDAFQVQLRACLAGDGALHGLVPVAGRGAPEGAWLLPLIGPGPAGPISGPAAQRFTALRRLLMQPGAPALEQLWRALDRGDAIHRWLDRQPDRHRLLQRLGGLRQVKAVDHWLRALLPAELRAPDETMRHCAALLRQSGCWKGASALLERRLQDVFWSVSFDARAHTAQVGELLAKVALGACLRLGISWSDYLAACRNQTPSDVPMPWRRAYALMLKRSPQAAITAPIPSPHAGFAQDYLARYLDHPRLAEAARHLLRHGRPPCWFGTRQLELTRLLHDVFALRPDLLPALLQGLRQQPAAMFRLSHIVPFAWLAGAMRSLAPDRHADIALLEQWQHCLDVLLVPGADRVQRQAALFDTVLEHWLANDWAALAPDRLAATLCWRWLRAGDVGKGALRQALARQLDKVPGSLRRPLVHALAESATGRVEKRPAATPKVPAIKPLAREAHALAVPLRINNAGLVILQSFIRPLFNRLHLVENDKFVSASAQRHAVHCLQFLVTGHEQTEEQFLLLNKLLCGLAPHEPVEYGIALTAEHKEIAVSLLEAAIAHWSAMGKCSVDGMRGSWLVRDGSLSEVSDRWNLIVEKRVYDVLLARSPFSYSIIKLPWMEKAIYVTWPT